MAKLTTHVHVRDDVGEAHVFGPGDDVPAWAAKKITNPAVWGEASETDPTTGSVDGPPPRTGKGAGRDAWAAYAAEQGVEVPGDAKRDDIGHALQDAGVPVDRNDGEE